MDALAGPAEPLPTRATVARTFGQYPRTFWLLCLAIVAAGVLGSGLPIVRVPLLAVFMPAVFIITMLCEVATCILISVILGKSRRWELQPLIILFLATALLDLAVFLTIRLPGRHDSLIVPGNAASPWLFACVHVFLSIGAVSYGAARSRKVLLTKAATRRALRLWFPIWAVVLVLGIALVIAFSQHTTGSPGSERTSGAERIVLFGAELLIGVAALIVYFRYIERADPNWIDLSIALTMIAGVVGLAMNVRDVPRYAPAWVAAELLYLCSATFVLIAAIRDLVVRLGDNLRVESQALRIRVATAEQNAEVETSMLKSRFVAMVSHELRTPLGGIIGMAELLEREPLSERQARFTAAIRTSANGLHRIVDDLLDFSRAESGRIELEDEAFDLEQALDDIVVLYREQARERGVALYAFVDPVLPRTIRGDQTRIKQVLQNLVGNALRFTVTGSIRIEVMSSVDDGVDEMLHFFVSDTGVGIAAEAQTRIFDAFVQEDASTARKFGGTGLGLTIARYLVELMGGKIEVWSRVNVGTTFSFTLPARAASIDRDTRGALRDMTILVFEQDLDARLLLMRYVEGWEMRAVGSSTGDDARAAVAHQAASGRRFDALLVGAGVSDDVAAALLREIRRDVATAPATAILLRDGEETGVGGRAGGFDHCIVGPLRQSTLFDTIVRLRRNGFAATVVPTIQGVPARARRVERVLVAEDNEVNQTLLSAQLEHLGLHPDIVTNGQAAVDAAGRVAYDLIFMDCQMPGMDGLEATRVIRAADARDVPIVALTAHVLPGYRETCLAAGMTDYLPKPALIGPLTGIVDRWLPAPGHTVAGVASVPATASDTAGALVRMRERLREIFHGDVARADRVIATSLTALKAGVIELEHALADRSATAAASTAHRLKGIALEIGSVEIADRARELERAVNAREWNEAEAELHAFISSVSNAALAVEERS